MSKNPIIESPSRRARGLHGGPPSLARGAAAGFLGGVAGSAAKLLVEKLFPPRTHGQQAPPVILAEKVAGHSLSGSGKALAMHGMHWTFGPLVGAAYGALVEFEPQLTDKSGIAFGLGVNALAHEKVLPWMGLTAPADEQPRKERWSEAASHAVYGLVTETVRRMIRGR